MSFFGFKKGRSKEHRALSQNYLATKSCVVVLYSLCEYILYCLKMTENNRCTFLKRMAKRRYCYLFNHMLNIYRLNICLDNLNLLLGFMNTCNYYGRYVLRFIRQWTKKLQQWLQHMGGRYLGREMFPRGLDGSSCGCHLHVVL